MSKLAEYIEKFIADGFKRESDQEENVVRSLPFFATSLGVLAASIGVVRGALCPQPSGWLEIGSYAALVGVSASTLLVFGFLVNAIRPRTFSSPMRETALIEYANALEQYYAAGLPNDPNQEEKSQTAALADVRTALTEDLAIATERNRANNLKRLKARTLAILSLVLGIFFAFVTLGLILAKQAFYGGGCNV